MPEHPTSRVRFERLGSVAIVTLAAPERLNAVSRDDQERLREIWDEVRTDPDIRCAVVTGEGRAFCAGAHMGSLAAHAANGANQPETFSSFTPRLRKVFKPIITAVNGICAGAGLHFIVDSDIVIVSENALFTDPHVDFGQVSGQEPAGLLRKIPMERVMRMVVLGRAERIDAATAVSIGLASELVPADQLLPRALELARLAAHVSPAAVQASLQAIWESLDLPLTDAYDNAYRHLAAHRSHPDALEGPTAFQQKRPPVWSRPAAASDQQNR
jgi:enoyl-CoA hydratase/carnithine racemase